MVAGSRIALPISSLSYELDLSSGIEGTRSTRIQKKPNLWGSWSDLLPSGV
jgi:hypothetical protein